MRTWTPRGYPKNNSIIFTPYWPLWTLFRSDPRSGGDIPFPGIGVYQGVSPPSLATEGFLLYYDRDGIPLPSVQAWAELNQDWSYKRVARTTVVSAADLAVAYDVSTVWLGIDHSFGGDGPPLIFETIVFGDGAEDLSGNRYATWNEAVAGHHELVVTVAATLDDPVVMETKDDPFRG